MTGIEPARPAWKFKEPVRIIHPELQVRSSTSARERPCFSGANGTLMACRWTRRAAVTRAAARALPRVLQLLFATGHGDRELERGGDTGDTPSWQVSPVSELVSAGQVMSGDTGDTSCRLGEPSFQCLSTMNPPPDGGFLEDLGSGLSGGGLLASPSRWISLSMARAAMASPTRVNR
jgi:hypothetical protein